MAWVCSSSLSILINGSLAIDFHSKRRLHQRGHFSLFLFIFVTEGIACLMKNARINHWVHLFNLSTQLQLDFLQFDFLQCEDNTMILGHPSWENIWSIKSMLWGFKLASSPSINFHKHNYYWFWCWFKLLEGSFRLSSMCYQPFFCLCFLVLR